MALGVCRPGIALFTTFNRLLLINMQILNSASKIVFIMLALTACAGFFMKLLDPKDFMVLSGMAFSFYFANKGDSNLPFAGK